MDNFIQQFPTTQNLVNAGLVAGTTSTYTTTATTSCVINGKFGTQLTAQTNTASPTTDANTGAVFTALTANQATVLVWGINAAGAIKLCQGTIVPTETGVTTTAGAFITAPNFPVTPDDFCPIGYQLVRTSPTGSAFTAEMAPSSWRPPWLDTITASKPASTARAASSGRWTPLIMSGPFHVSRRRFTSSQFNSSPRKFGNEPLGAAGAPPGAIRLTAPSG
jgi:hypothetical protein